MTIPLSSVLFIGIWVMLAAVTALVSVVVSEAAIRDERWRIPMPIRYVIGVGTIIAAFILHLLLNYPSQIRRALELLALATAMGMPVLINWRFNRRVPVEHWDGFANAHLRHEVVEWIENEMAGGAALEDCLSDALTIAENMKHWRQKVRDARKES